MKAHTALSAMLLIGLGASLFAQPEPTTEKLTFEVASIRPTKTRLPGPMWSGGARQTSVTGLTPLMLILGAFDLHVNEVIGAPAWIEAEQYDINAAYEGQRTADERSAMMRALAEERFALKSHMETRDAPIFRAVLTRKDGALGPRLARSTIPCEASGRAMPCGMRASGSTVQMSAQTVRYFLNYVESVVGRRIVDETGLAGPFEITLEWARGPNDVERPSVFTALQEQLGVRLEPSRGPVKVLVIDSISRD